MADPRVEVLARRLYEDWVSEKAYNAAKNGELIASPFFSDLSADNRFVVIAASILADLDDADPRDEVIRGLVEALRAIDVGQSAIPDHWEYRCMARNTASAALAAAAKAYGVALPTIVHQRKTGKSTRSVK